MTLTDFFDAMAPLVKEGKIKMIIFDENGPFEVEEENDDIGDDE